MPKAFLSHASVDKEYVEAVAARLGRARSHIDVRSFAPGDDFRASILRTLADSEVFVFFVSEASLASTWVRFELDEADLRTLAGSLKKSVAVFLDGPVDPQVLPRWLRTVKAVEHTSPARTARVVEMLSAETTDADDRPFVGRNEDLQRGSRKLTAGEPIPRVVVVSGLAGVGRRSYARRLLSDTLGLDLGPTITLGTSATLEDIFVEAQRFSMVLTRDEAEEEVRAFRALDSTGKSREVALQLSALTREGSVPCIVDHGAMLDSTGRYQPDYQAVIGMVIDQSDGYLCLIHTRAPYLQGVRGADRMFVRKLLPLEQPDAQVLITRLLRDAHVPVTPESTSRLAEVTNGYPPAAYYLAAQIEQYGVGVVLADGAGLTAFYTRNFSRFLRDLHLGADEHSVLAYLASETKLSLPGIAIATGIPPADAAVALRTLIDLSLVQAMDDDYAVAAPIQTTVQRSEPALGRRWYEAAFKRLEQEFWSKDNSLPALSVVDATLRAGFRIGRHAVGESLVRPSLLVGAAGELYNQQEYATALEYLDRAEQMGGRTTKLLELKVKSLAQLRRFPAAYETLREYRESGERRSHYLEGFIERKQGRHGDAAKSFQRGYSLGDRTVSLLRDYADSLLRLEAYADAANVVAEALSIAGGDLWLRDLAARVEIASGSLDQAETALDALDAVDVGQVFALQRRAAFLIQRRGHAEAIRRAIVLAEEACEQRNARLDSYIVLARALIRKKDWARLGEVREEIARRRGGPRDPVLRSLELDAAVARGDWRRAERQLPDGLTSAADRDAKAAVLDLKSVDRNVSLADRQAAEAEARALREVPSTGFGPQDAALYE